MTESPWILVESSPKNQAPQKDRISPPPKKKNVKKSIQGGPLPVISCKYSFRRFSFDIRWCCPPVFYCIFTDETSTMASCRNKNVAFLWRTLKTTTRERSIKRKNFMKHLSSRRSNIEDSISFFVIPLEIYTSQITSSFV